jgi:hypothetical protein
MSKHPKWQTADVIDLEYFFAADQEQDERELRRRDQEIYVRQVKPCLEAVPAPGRNETRAKLHCWLAARRAIEQQKSTGEVAGTPGEFYQIAMRSLLWISCALGLLIGGGLVLSLFRWYADRPINVTWFFAETVLVQLVVLCAVLLLLLRSHRTLVRPSVLQTLISAALAKLAGLGEKALGHFSGERRNRVHAGLGVIRAKKAIYGSLAYWPVLIVTQVFAVGFNLGLLVTILSCVRFSALSFGWYSTLERPNQALLVDAVSLPWSWLPNAKPSHEQVEKSRVVPAQSPLSLPKQSNNIQAEALRSWWPFLCYAAVFYGLLPRGLLLALAAWKQRRTLDQIPFTHGDCQTLLARLGGLAVETGKPGPILETPPQIPLSDEARAASCIALASAEMEVPEKQLVEIIESNLRQRVTRLIRAEVDSPDECGDALKTLELAAAAKNGDPVSVAIAVEAWQPPRQAYLSFIQAVRGRVGKTANIAVMLVADAVGASAAVADEDWQVWLQKIRGLGDPYLRLERQVSPA